MIVFLVKVTDLITFFLSSPALGVCIKDTCAGIVYYIRITYIKNTNAKGIGTEDTCTWDACNKVIGSTSIEYTYIENNNTKDTYVNNTSVRSAFINDVYCIREASIRNFCDFSAVKH